MKVPSPLFASYCMEAVQRASGFGPVPREILELIGKDELEIKFGLVNLIWLVSGPTPVEPVELWSKVRAPLIGMLLETIEVAPEFGAYIKLF